MNVDPAIWVALITGGFSVVVALIGKLLRNNRRDHDTVIRMLVRISRKLDKHVEDGDAHRK